MELRKTLGKTRKHEEILLEHVNLTPPFPLGLNIINTDVAFSWLCVKNSPDYNYTTIVQRKSEHLVFHCFWLVELSVYILLKHGFL